MIRTALHIQRLKILARHLRTVNTRNEYSHIGYSPGARGRVIYFYKARPYIINPIILLEMEKLFTGFFSVNKYEVTVYGPRKDSIVFAIPYFFGLDFNETEHLFFPNRQHTYIYSGKTLHATSSVKVIADNIYAFLKATGDEPMVDAKITVRRVLTEKITSKHPEFMLSQYRKV